MEKLLFFLKDGLKGDESAIYGQIKAGRTQARFSTGVRITKKRWHETEKLRKTLRNRDEVMKQARLKRLVSKFDSLLYDERQNIEHVNDANWLKCKLLDKEPKVDKGKTLMDAIDFYIEYFKKLVAGGQRAASTLERNMTVKKIVKEFLKHEYLKDDIPINKLDKSFVYKFDTFLRTERRYKTNIGIGNNTTVKYISNLKTIISFVEKNGWLESNPLKAYDGRLKKVNTVFLEEFELQKIESYNTKIDRLERIKNIFLFSCYTGLAPVDVTKASWDNYMKDDAGRDWLVIERTKTGVRADIYLLPEALNIMEIYKNDPRCFKSNLLFPEISNQKMNAYLKEIADCCGIGKNLTWYVARHTFATTVTLNEGIPMEIVSKLMGHTNIKQTQHYAKLQRHSIRSCMDKINTKYK